MPNWRIAAVLFISLQVACTRATDRTALIDRIALVDGKPIEQTIGGVRVSFDGKSALAVSAHGRTKSLDAKTPAVVSISRDGRFLMHNYGDGSGQVYDIGIYSSNDWNTIDISSFRRSVLQFARSNGCTIQSDQISFVFTSWHGSSSVNLRTEDFSRKEGCAFLNRAWQIDLPRGTQY